MTGNLTCRLFEGEDLESLERYYVGSRGKLLDRVLWEWQYRKNIASRGDPPGFVCVDSTTGEFIGCILSTPWLYRYRDDVYYCTVGSDAFIRQEYRGKNLYNHLASYALTEGVPLLGSFRVLFYNDVTRTARTSAPTLIKTSISIRVQNPKKFSECIFGNSMKATLSNHILRHFKRKSKPSGRIKVHEGNLNGFAEAYEEWTERDTYIHTPRTKDYLRWRFKERPSGGYGFYSVWQGDEQVGYMALLHDPKFNQHPLRTLTISDYYIKNNDHGVFRSAVEYVVNMFPESDIVTARTFSTPGYQKSLKDIGFLDSLHFPLNQVLRPGGMGLRVYDERCRSFNEKPWYLTQADCF